MKRFLDWYRFHKTAKYVIARLEKAVEYWMNEALASERAFAVALEAAERWQDKALELEKEIETIETPMFVWVDEGNGVAPTIPNEADLGEFPPYDCDCIPEPTEGFVVSLFRREGPI